MTKSEFLQALEAGLAAASPEERVAALQYYTEYLDEAGPEREAQVIEELGAPDAVAKDILGAATGDKNSGEKAGGGQWAPPNPPPPLGEALKTAGESIWHAGEELFGRIKEDMGAKPGEDRAGAATAAGQAHSTQQGAGGYAPPPATTAGGYNPRNNSLAKAILIVLFVIFLFPLLGGVLGLLGGGLGVLSGAFVALALLFFCPILLALGLVLGGVVGVLGGVVLLPVTVGSGLLTMGLGTCLIGLGLMCLYGGVRLLGSVLPRIFRWGFSLVASLLQALRGLLNRIFRRHQA